MTANGKYKNVYAKIYMSSSGKVSCRIFERKKVEGVFKMGTKLRINDLVDESVRGSCVLKVYQGRCSRHLIRDTLKNK